MKRMTIETFDLLKSKALGNSAPDFKHPIELFLKAVSDSSKTSNR